MVVSGKERETIVVTVVVAVVVVVVVVTGCFFADINLSSALFEPICRALIPSRETSNDVHCC